MKCSICNDWLMRSGTALICPTCTQVARIKEVTITPTSEGEDKVMHLEDLLCNTKGKLLEAQQKIEALQAEVSELKQKLKDEEWRGVYQQCQANTSINSSIAYAKEAEKERDQLKDKLEKNKTCAFRALNGLDDIHSFCDVSEVLQTILMSVGKELRAIESENNS